METVLVDFIFSKQAQATALLLEQVRMALSKGTRTVLPSLETLGLYSYTNGKKWWPTFQIANSLAHQRGAWGVCKEVGRLVSVGALPSLKQVKLTKPPFKSFLPGRCNARNKSSQSETCAYACPQGFNRVLPTYFLGQVVSKEGTGDNLLLMKQRLFCKVYDVAYTSQVNLYPVTDKAWKELLGPGPPLEDAPHVKSFFLPEPEGWQEVLTTWTRPSHLDEEHQRRCSPQCGI